MGNSTKIAIFQNTKECQAQNNLNKIFYKFLDLNPSDIGPLIRIFYRIIEQVSVHVIVFYLNKQSF